MRIKIIFYVNDRFKFKNHLNTALSAYIYRCIELSSVEYSNKLHGEGISKLGYKKFNFYTYALCQNKEIVTDTLEKGCAELILSSAVEDTIFHFLKGLVKLGQIQLYSHSFNIVEIKKQKEISIKEGIFRVVAPIHMLNIEKEELNPFEMQRYLVNNLITKYNALYKKLPPILDVNVKFLDYKKHIVKYKNNSMTAYSGSIAIQACPELIKLAYDAGIGSRNGCGLGLISKL